MATKYEVHTVHHILIRAGKTVGYFDSDLIFVDGTPLIVFEWELRPTGDVPAVTVPLDLEYLTEFEWGAADYLYELPVEDPRRFD